MPTVTQAELERQYTANLAALRSLRVTPEESIDYHEEPNRKIYLAGGPPQMAKEEAYNALGESIQTDNEYTTYTRSFQHRPGDGAVAVNAVMREHYSQFLGKKTWVQDPQMISVEVAYGVTKSVPWGLCKLPLSFGPKAQISIGSTHDSVYGPVLYLQASAIKKMQGALEYIFDEVHEHLVKHSIYRGQACTASEVPQFIDINSRAKEIVFAAPTEWRLDFRLFKVIEREDTYIELGNDGKMIVWIHGDYGVGKSELAAKLARLAVANGWGFYPVRPGVDSFDYAMQMAKMNAPRCIVFVEDAESVTGVDSPDQVAKMLDQLDGTEAKLLQQTIFVFTTNFIDKVQKAALRYGRAEAIIRLGNLDRAGCEKLAHIELGDMLADDVDYDAVYAAMGGVVLDEGGLPYHNDQGELVYKAEADLTPAFMRQAFNTAKMVCALYRGKNQKVTTEDILNGVIDLQEQLQIHRAAPEPKPREQLNAAMQQALMPMVREVVNGQLGQFADVVYERAREAADSVVESRIHGAQINRESDGETWARVSTQ